MPRSGIVESSCTCPYFEDRGPCKHIWATMLAADARGLGPRAGSRKLSVLTPESDEWDLDDEPDELEEDEAFFGRRYPSAGPGRPRFSPWQRPRSPSPAGWQQQLSAVFEGHAASGSGDTALPLVGKNREAWYVLDVTSSHRNRRLDDPPLSARDQAERRVRPAQAVERRPGGCRPVHKARRPRDAARPLGERRGPRRRVRCLSRPLWLLWLPRLRAEDLAGVAGRRGLRAPAAEALRHGALRVDAGQLAAGPGGGRPPAGLGRRSAVAVPLVHRSGRQEETLAAGGPIGARGGERAASPENARAVAGQRPGVAGRSAGAAGGRRFLSLDRGPAQSLGHRGPLPGPLGVAGSPVAIAVAAGNKSPAEPPLRRSAPAAAGPAGCPFARTLWPQPALRRRRVPVRRQGSPRRGPLRGHGRARQGADPGPRPRQGTRVAGLPGRTRRAARRCLGFPRP